MFVTYRAKDREEYWRLRYGLAPPLEGETYFGQDADGLAPDEDRRRALEVAGSVIDEWSRGGATFARIELTRYLDPAGTLRHVEGARRSELAWPAAMKPGEYRRWSG